MKLREVKKFPKVTVEKGKSQKLGLDVNTYSIYLKRGGPDSPGCLPSTALRPLEVQRKRTSKGQLQNPEEQQKSQTRRGHGASGIGWGERKAVGVGRAGRLTSFMPRQFFSRLL